MPATGYEDKYQETGAAYRMKLSVLSVVANSKLPMRDELAWSGKTLTNSKLGLRARGHHVIASYSRIKISILGLLTCAIVQDVWLLCY